MFFIKIIFIFFLVVYGIYVAFTTRLSNGRGRYAYAKIFGVVGLINFVLGSFLVYHQYDFSILVDALLFQGDDIIWHDRFIHVGYGLILCSFFFTLKALLLHISGNAVNENNPTVEGDRSGIFQRFFHWLETRERWTEEHDESWGGKTEPQDNGLSLFQESCYQQLETAMSENGISLTDKIISGESEKYIITSLPKAGLKLFIYLDGAAIEDGIRLEEWGFKTPEELIDKYVKTAVELELKATSENNKSSPPYSDIPGLRL